MSDDKKPSAVKVLNGYFGKKAGQSLKDFAAEIADLTDVDKDQLVEGISNGSYTY